MTEQEWLASVDPVAMLDWLMANRKPSDRKLRLFHEAALKCDDFDFARNIHWTPCPGGHGRRLTAIVKWSGDRTHAEQYCHFALDTDAGSVAHILRDIVGNPWRPVTLPLGEKCETCLHFPPGAEIYCSACRGTGHGPSPILTPLVVSLAEAAYTERQQPDGTLCPDRLAILSDALEDAGLSEVECRVCKGNGIVDVPDNGSGLNLYAIRACPGCTPRGLWIEGTGRQPHPLLAALRDPGSHYPGFWCLDLLLGRL